LVAPWWPEYGLNAYLLLTAYLLVCSDVNKDFQPAEPRPSRRSWLLKPRYDLASKDKANLGQYQGQDSFPYGEFKDKVTDLDCKAETKAKDLNFKPRPRTTLSVLIQGVTLLFKQVYVLT